MQLISIDDKALDDLIIMSYRYAMNRTTGATYLFQRIVESLMAEKKLPEVTLITLIKELCDDLNSNRIPDVEVNGWRNLANSLTKYHLSKQ